MILLLLEIFFVAATLVAMLGAVVFAKTMDFAIAGFHEAWDERGGDDGAFIY